MAFKAEVDDIRDSLSFKLKKILLSNNANVFVQMNTMRMRPSFKRRNYQEMFHHYYRCSSQKL